MQKVLAVISDALQKVAAPSPEWISAWFLKMVNENLAHSIKKQVIEDYVKCFIQISLHTVYSKYRNS